MTSPCDLALVSAAAAFAARRHVGQTRKGVAREPYLNHLAEVAYLLATIESPDAELIAAGWLHDTVEDTATTRDELAQTFGERVAAIVVECTDDKSLSKNERKRLQVVETPHKSADAKRVKLADKTSNLRDIASSPPDGWSEERCLAYVDWAGEVAVSCRGLSAALDEAFDSAVAEARRAIAARGQVANTSAAMKNVQVIDGARNCTYSIFAFDEEQFRTIFPAPGQDIAFIEEVAARVGDDRLGDIIRSAWNRMVDKNAVQGIHGTLFYELEFKRQFYPTLKDSEMVTGI